MPVYQDRSSFAANQGDIFKEVPFPFDFGAGKSLGMVISHDCEIDKFVDPKTPLSKDEREKWTVTVALVHHASALPSNRYSMAKKDKMPRYVFLEAEDDIPELVVDLWTEQPVRMLDLMACDRLASPSTETRVRLWWKIVRLRLGKDFKKILEGEVPPDAA